MKVAILGFGRQGKSALEYYLAKGYEITVCDINEDLNLPENVACHLGKDYLKKLDQFDVIVRSPLIHPDEITKFNDSDILDKVTSVTNEFFRISPSKNIIGITGSKGKGTTSLLVAEILKQLGLRVHLGGNIGIAPLELLKEEINDSDWIILELANFQTIDLAYSPHIAVCLMMVPEHLDWHGSLENYVGAKKQMFKFQESCDFAIYYAKNQLSKEIANEGKGVKIPYFREPGAIVRNNNFEIDNQVICGVNETSLMGEHNWQNICAAITAVWQVLRDVKAIRQALILFNPPEHRLELVRRHNGVYFYNDSFASNPAATVAAINAVKGNKVLIIGGYDRGIPLRQLTETIVNSESDLPSVLLIGASSNVLAKSLANAGYSNYQIVASKSMKEIVNLAARVAPSGSSVILSPGFASFDMFRDFEDRGDQFKQAVLEL